jgi:twitching motility protein PilJ
MPPLERVERADKSAAVILAQKNALTEVGQSLRFINKQSFDLLDGAETLLTMRLQRDTPTAEIAGVEPARHADAADRQVGERVPDQRGRRPEAAFLLDRDLKTFGDVSKAAARRQPAMNLGGARDPQVRDRLAALIRMFQETRTRGSDILKNLPGLNAARDAQAAIIKDSEPLRKELETVQEQLGNETGLSGITLLLLLLSAVLVVLGGAGFLRLYVAEQGQRASLAQSRRLEAEGQEKEAKRVNDANQAAICGS